MPRALEVAVVMKAAGGIPRGLRCDSPQFAKRSGGRADCQVLWPNLTGSERPSPTRNRGKKVDDDSRRLDALGAGSGDPAALPACLAADQRVSEQRDDGRIE